MLDKFLSGKEVETLNGSIAFITSKDSEKVTGIVTFGEISIPTSWTYSGSNKEFHGWNISNVVSKVTTPAQPFIKTSSEQKGNTVSEEYDRKLVTSMKETKLNQLKESLSWFMDNDVEYLVSNLPLLSKEDSIQAHFEITANEFEQTRKLIVEFEEYYSTEVELEEE